MKYIKYIYISIFIIAVVLQLWPIFAIAQTDSGLLKILKVESKVEKTDEGLSIRIDWTMEKPGQYSYLFSKGQDDQEYLARYQPPTAGSTLGGFYIDPDVREGETYTYSVVASDEMASISDKSTIKVVAKLADCKVDETEMHAGLFGGTSSFQLTPSRYTLNGGDKNNLIPVGAVHYSLYVAPNQNQQNETTSTTQFSDASVKTTLNGVGTSLREILCKMIAKISPNKLTKVAAGLIDNGASSGVAFTNLPAGDYLIFMSKSGFKSSLVEFPLAVGQKAVLPPAKTALEPENGAEPPAFSGSTLEKVEKTGGKVIHRVSGRSGASYVYYDIYPWWGWQNESQLKTDKPKYSKDQPGVAQ